jgi:peptide/nickel transport system substrate-binding protein
MTHPEEIVPNDRLRRARSLKGWSQAELAEQVGTSFEMVSRWERGVTLPSPYYRERLCAILGEAAEDLGLMQAPWNLSIPSSSRLVFLASSHVDAERAFVSRLKTTLQERDMVLWSSRQVGRQKAESVREVVRAAQAVLVIVSPDARSSRHVKEALELARTYQRPTCGVWIEGERWQECLPKGVEELTALIDARKRDDPALFEEMTSAIEHVGLNSSTSGVSALATGGEEIALPSNLSEELIEPITQQNQVTNEQPPSNSSLKKRSTTMPLLARLPLPSILTSTSQGSTSHITRGMLIGLVLLVIAGTILAGGRLLSYFNATGAEKNTPTANVVRGGTWTEEAFADPDSLIPNGGQDHLDILQALYLPLFYGDAQGVIHPGAATEVPTVQNGGISADITTWTFHLKPRLVWSDGRPYDARDVDYTWKTWINPQFGARLTDGYDQISSADVSADHLTITFHLKRAYAPFLSLWVDGMSAPLPMHYFSSMAVQAILKSSDNLNPRVTSGPFQMEESVPGNHYTLVRNPRYYRANQGLPYLDKVVFRIAVNEDAILKDFQADAITSAQFLQISHVQAYQGLKGYTFLSIPTSVDFEGLFFNFRNTVLATHLEVRQAMAMAVDHQTLIDRVLPGLATPLCTDHPSFVHPGYAPTFLACNCQVFDPAAANKLLDDSGWVKGSDGVRTKGKQRLEFEYSTSVPLNQNQGRTNIEAIIQREFRDIGIKLDIQNYPHFTFFNQFLQGAQPSPPTGALAGRFDIGEWDDGFFYDPDDSWILACDQLPPTGANFGAYCNHTLDTLYKQEQAAVDPGVRQYIFNQIHQIYLEELPLIVLYSPLPFEVVRKGTHNFHPTPITVTANIWEWWCDQGQCSGK